MRDVLNPELRKILWFAFGPVAASILDRAYETLGVDQSKHYVQHIIVRRVSTEVYDLRVIVARTSGKGTHALSSADDFGLEVWEKNAIISILAKINALNPSEIESVYFYFNTDNHLTGIQSHSKSPVIYLYPPVQEDEEDLPVRKQKDDTAFPPDYNQLATKIAMSKPHRTIYHVGRVQLLLKMATNNAGQDSAGTNALFDKRYDAALKIYAIEANGDWEEFLKLLLRKARWDNYVQSAGI